ncbi:hypothetical protein D3C72_2413280 [compost metagenome]
MASGSDILVGYNLLQIESSLLGTLLGENLPHHLGLRGGRLARIGIVDFLD